MHNYNKMYGVRHRYNVPVLFTSPSALGDIHAGSIVTLDRWSFYLNFACEAQFLVRSLLPCSSHSIVLVGTDTFIVFENREILSCCYHVACVAAQPRIVETIGILYTGGLECLRWY